MKPLNQTEMIKQIFELRVKARDLAENMHNLLEETEKVCEGTNAPIINESLVFEPILLEVLGENILIHLAVMHSFSEDVNNDVIKLHSNNFPFSMCDKDSIPDHIIGLRDAIVKFFKDLKMEEFQ